MFRLNRISPERSAFTLIELLMVVAIIALLASLVVVTMSGIVEQAQVEATKATVLKVSRLLDDRVVEFDRAFEGPRRDSYVQATVGLLTAIDGRFDYFNTNPDEAPPAIRLLAYKAAFRFEMPQRMAELTVGSPTAGSIDSALSDMPLVIYRQSAFPVARRQLIDDGNTNPTGADVIARVVENWTAHLDAETAAQVSDLDDVHSTESSELLYFTLVQSGSFGATSSVADEFLSSEIADTDGDGFLEFVDSWGQPLQFYRWPTRLIDPTAPNPFVPDFSNPNDPTEVDPTPDDSESPDGLREILSTERDLASLTFKGLPPTPQEIPFTSPAASGATTQRDMLLVDPDDPVGVLYTFIEDPKYKAMGIDLTAEYNEANYHTPDTYHAPLIVSAGPDELLGLREPNNTDIANGIFGNLAQYAGTFAPGFGTPVVPPTGGAVFESLLDNITNRNRRAGARR